MTVASFATIDALLALDDADPGHDPGGGRGTVVELPRRERVQLEQSGAGVDQPVDPLTGGQLPARAVALDGLLAASTRDDGSPVAQLRDQRLHPLGAPREGLAALELRGEECHEISLTNGLAGADNGPVRRDVSFVPLLVAGGAVAILPPALIHFVSRDPVMFSSGAHFWSVVLSSVLATAAGVALSYGGWRRGDGRAVLVGTAFTVMASLLLVHGFASPGFIVEMNGVVSLTGAATLPVGALILALSALPATRSPRAVTPLLWLQAALMVGVVGLGLAALWLPELVPSVPEPASPAALAMLVLGLALLRPAGAACSAHGPPDAPARRPRRLHRARLAGRGARARADADLSRSRLVARARARGRGCPPRRRAGRVRPLPLLALAAARRRSPRRRARLRRGDVPRLAGRRPRSSPRGEGRVHGGPHAPGRAPRRRRGGGARAAAGPPARSSPPAACCTTSASSRCPTRC